MTQGVSPDIQRDGALTRALRYIDDAARASAEYSQRHFRSLGLLTFVVPLAYLVDLYVGKPNYDTLGIRVVAFLMALPLIFYNTGPLRNQKYFHAYFVALVAYVLPFSFGLMLTLNAANAPHGSQIEMLWVLQYVIALFLFIQLIHHGPLATILWTLSTAFALLPLLALDDVNWEEFKRAAVYPVSGYLTALFFGIVTNRNVDYVNAEKLRAASAIGGNIAHELRTPLASIRSLARAVRRHSEVLVDAYSSAKAAGLEVGELNNRQVSGLRDAIATIEREVDYSNTIIDMLLLNTTQVSSRTGPKELLSISEIVTEAIKRYPFNNTHERQLINLEVASDFRIDAPRVLITHVFFNLLKNSVYFAQNNSEGRVHVRIGESNRRLVSITDTGAGMPPSTRRRVFDRFYTTAKPGQGAGIGLSFCKMVMESLGGEIQCESKEGEYTTFRLTFPPVSEPETPTENSQPALATSWEDVRSD